MRKIFCLMGLLIFGLVLLLPFPVMQGQQSDCPATALLNGVTATGDLITVAGPPRIARICSVTVQIQQTTPAANFGLVYGTGTACGTNQGNLTPQWTGVAGAQQSFTLNVPSNASMMAPAGNNVCLKLSATPTSANVHALYRIY